MSKWERERRKTNKADIERDLERLREGDLKLGMFAIEEMMRV